MRKQFLSIGTLLSIFLLLSITSGCAKNKTSYYIMSKESVGFITMYSVIGFEHLDQGHLKSQITTAITDLSLSTIKNKFNPDSIENWDVQKDGTFKLREYPEVWLEHLPNGDIKLYPKGLVLKRIKPK